MDTQLRPDQTFRHPRKQGETALIRVKSPQHYSTNATEPINVPVKHRNITLKFYVIACCDPLPQINRFSVFRVCRRRPPEVARIWK